MENDMDELFRKAVDQYLLKPCESRWDEISSRLSYDSDKFVVLGANPKVKKTNSVRRQFCLFLISFSFLTTFIKHEEFSNPPNSTGDYSKMLQFLLPDKVLESRNFEHLIRQEHGLGYFSPVIRKQPTDLQFLKGSIKSRSFYDISNLVIKNQPVYMELQLGDEENVFLPKHVDEQVADIQPVNKQIQDSRGDQKKLFAALNAFDNPKPIELKFESQKSGNLSLHRIQTNHNQGFYLGLLTGPLWSQVDHGEITKPGFDLGILTGYKINKKFSVETGLLYAEQYYSIGGKNYNRIPGVSEAKKVESNRAAFKIPINLDYNILQNRSGNLFISTGFTSYVGVKENIVIHVGENISRPPQTLDYGTASYIPSYLNVSLGYNYKIGKLLMLRFEPYIEIPISKAAGNTMNINETRTLQVYNLGFHLGITRLIH
jgi:hypothetical protein